jgi:hypothetical protein
MASKLAILATLGLQKFSAHNNVESANELLSNCQDFLDSCRQSAVGFTLA